MRRALTFALTFAAGLAATSVAHAAKDNKFSASVALGEAYQPVHYRLSFGSFDLGFGLAFEPYNSPEGGWYGLIGYEWRPIKVVGLMFEFNGSCLSGGSAYGLGLIGLTVGW